MDYRRVLAIDGSQKMTRRKWTAGLSTAVIAGATSLSGQVATKTPPQGAPAPAPPSATRQQKLEKAYADVRKVSERLASIEVPMDVEPAFAFRT